MSDLQTARVDSTDQAPVSTIGLPLVLVADPDGSSRSQRADQLQARGFRVAVARTSFEAIVKASCLVPDLILMAASLVQDTAELISTCPVTSHIPIVRVSAGRRLPPRVLSLAR